MAQSGDNSLIYSTSLRTKSEKLFKSISIIFERFYYEFWS